jgi:hypothetical protein
MPATTRQTPAVVDPLAPLRPVLSAWRWLVVAAVGGGLLGGAVSLLLPARVAASRLLLWSADAKVGSGTVPSRLAVERLALSPAVRGELVQRLQPLDGATAERLGLRAQVDPPGRGEPGNSFLLELTVQAPDAGLALRAVEAWTATLVDHDLVQTQQAAVLALEQELAARAAKIPLNRASLLAQLEDVRARLASTSRTLPLRSQLDAASVLAAPPPGGATSLQSEVLHPVWMELGRQQLVLEQSLASLEHELAALDRQLGGLRELAARLDPGGAGGSVRPLAAAEVAAASPLVLPTRGAVQPLAAAAVAAVEGRRGLDRASLGAFAGLALAALAALLRAGSRARPGPDAP